VSHNVFNLSPAHNLPGSWRFMSLPCGRFDGVLRIIYLDFEVDLPFKIMPREISIFDEKVVSVEYFNFVSCNRMPKLEDNCFALIKYGRSKLEV